MQKSVLVIGDIHGHYDRFEALLKQEGIIGECPPCEGTGDDALKGGFCEVCGGNGISRLNHDVEVIQLGDLGHFGSERDIHGHKIPGSPTGDLLCYEAAWRGYIDRMLWGNHDRALVDEHHMFGGFIPPPRATAEFLWKMQDENRITMAWSAHDWLLTHAGLHIQFKYQNVDTEVKEDPAEFAKWMNALDQQYLNGGRERELNPVRDAISKQRNGRAPFGGILWRDAREKLYPQFKQVFGHTAGDKVRRFGNRVGLGGWSYCIDVGQPKNGRLAGIWLPEERIVEVNLNERKDK